MATINEIERSQAETAEREAKALAGLSQYLNEAITELPAQSLVAGHFAHMAPRIERAAERRGRMAHEIWQAHSQLLFEIEHQERNR